MIDEQLFVREVDVILIEVANRHLVKHLDAMKYEPRSMNKFFQFRSLLW